MQTVSNKPILYRLDYDQSADVSFKYFLLRDFLCFKQHGDIYAELVVHEYGFPFLVPSYTE